MQRLTAKKLVAKTTASAPKNILCLAFDRLNADFLGAYGNMWIETPAFDSLAAESILFDSYFATSLDLSTLYRAFWRGEAPYMIDESDSSSAQSSSVSLFRALKERGYRTYVVSDAEEATLHTAIDDDYCDGRFYLGAPDSESPAETLEETKFFRNFEELARFIAKLEDESEFTESSPWFVWAHFSGWNNIWDFPLKNREYYREDEEDPAPYGEVTPPFFSADALKHTNDAKKRATISHALESDKTRKDVLCLDLNSLKQLDIDDRRQSVVEAYAGGISVFDETLGGFLQLLKETEVLSKTLTILTGTRGMGTGFPSCLGVVPDGRVDRFYSEETRLPLAIRLPDGTGSTYRFPTLCEPRDLYETILSWSDFSNKLADPEFWKLESIEISPFAGQWSLDEGVKKPKSSSDDEQEKDELNEPDKPGQNLLTLLVDESRSVRERVTIVAKDALSEERAVVAQDFFLKSEPNPQAQNPELDEPKKVLRLFVRPDDLFCVNDVANRRVDDVERLQKFLF